MKNIQSVEAGAVYRFVPNTSEHSNRATTGPAERYSQDAYKLDLSDRASMLAQLAEVNEHRTERIARLRDEITNGIYETPDKIRVAAERLSDELL